MKAIELIGEPLEWAAATCEGFTLTTDGISMLLERGTELRLLGPHSSPLSYSPSTNWAQGGPIMDRERLKLTPRFPFHEDWEAECRLPTGGGVNAFGPTALIAGMRCYVASKLGDDVDVPELLLLRSAAQVESARGNSSAATTGDEGDQTPGTRLHVPGEVIEDAEDDQPGGPRG